MSLFLIFKSVFKPIISGLCVTLEPPLIPPLSLSLSLYLAYMLATHVESWRDSNTTKSPKLQPFLSIFPLSPFFNSSAHFVCSVAQGLSRGPYQRSVCCSDNPILKFAINQFRCLAGKHRFEAFRGHILDANTLASCCNLWILPKHLLSYTLSWLLCNNKSP